MLALELVENFVWKTWVSFVDRYLDDVKIEKKNIVYTMHRLLDVNILIFFVIFLQNRNGFLSTIFFLFLQSAYLKLHGLMFEMRRRHLAQLHWVAEMYVSVSIHAPAAAYEKLRIDVGRLSEKRTHQ